MRAYPCHVPGLTSWVASLPAADCAACWAAIDDLAHQMHGHDPTRTLEQCRADALVDLMLTNVTVSTTVTLMIPVQTLTVDEPPGALERDLLTRDQPTSTPRAGGAWLGGRDQSAVGDGSAVDDRSVVGDRSAVDDRSAMGDRAGGAPCYLDRLARVDDFGQPATDPNPMVEPTWAQIGAMGYEIPGIAVIGGDVVACILEKFDTRIARVLLDEHTGVVVQTRIKDYLPNKAMRRFIQARDGHCRLPGCARNATRCEPDHVIPFSRGGPTAIWTWPVCAITNTGSNTTPAGQ